MLIYLDQNYASRIAKFLLGQKSHSHFGALFEVLKAEMLKAEVLGGQSVLIPPSPFHVLELSDFLTREGSWERAADLRPLEGILSYRLTGGFLERFWQAKALLRGELGLGEVNVPFLELLAKLLALRSQEAERFTRPSDLTDLVMAATVGPYVDVLATDRYLRELTQRVGYRGRVYSGRVFEVQQLTADLTELLAQNYSRKTSCSDITHKHSS